MTEEEIRLRALELAVQLRQRTEGITGDLTVSTAIRLERYIKGESR